MHRTLDLLPPLSVKGKGFGAIIREAAKQGAQPAKPQFNVPKMKQVVKLAKAMGQEVAGYTVHGDGGFTVTTVEPTQAKKASKNPWDEVLE